MYLAIQERCALRSRSGTARVRAATASMLRTIRLTFLGARRQTNTTADTSKMRMIGINEICSGVM
jgi:hypothetical protein